MTGFDLERETQADGARLKTEASHQRTCSFCRTSVPISGICSGCGNRMGLLPSLPEIEAEPPAQPVEKIGCGGPWHYESHSVHSSCPSCFDGAPQAEVWDNTKQPPAQPPDIDALPMTPGRGSSPQDIIQGKQTRIEELEGTVRTYKQEWRDLTLGNREQAKTIERLEWAGRTVLGDRGCLACKVLQGTPHQPGCFVKAALEGTS